jgi:hypothetical protein
MIVETIFFEKLPESEVDTHSGNDGEPGRVARQSVSIRLIGK